jgi:hypothetical protein
MNGTKGMLMQPRSDKHGLDVALPFGAASRLRAATDRGPWWKVQMAAAPLAGCLPAVPEPSSSAPQRGHAARLDTMKRCLSAGDGGAAVR